MKSKIAVIGHLFTAYVDYRDDCQPKGAKRLESLAETLNQNGVNTVILAGDYVHTATKDNYRYLKRHFLDILHSDCIGLRSSHEGKGHAAGEIDQTTLYQVSDFYVPGSHPNIIMITHRGGIMLNPEKTLS